jgi:hypothetical protein
MTDLTLEQIEEREEFYRRQDEAIAREEEERRLHRAQVLSPTKRSVTPTKRTALPASGLRPSQVRPLKADEQVTTVIADPVPSGPRPAETEVKQETPAQPAETKERPGLRNAREELRKTFPGLQIQTFGLDAADIEFLEKRKLGSVPLAVRRVIDNFITQRPERTGIVLELMSEGKYPSGESKGVRIKATAPKLEAKTDPFFINQSLEIEKGKLVLHIESITAKGRGKAFFKESVIPQVLIADISKLTLSAYSSGSSSEGLVAWARYGFVPDQEAWDRMREKGEELLDEKDYSPIRRQVAGILQDPSPKALRRLIVRAWKERRERAGTTGPGPITSLLNRILQTGLWKGEIDMTDPKSVQWLTLYLSVTNAEERLEDFEKLLEPAPSFLSRFRKGK